MSVVCSEIQKRSRGMRRIRKTYVVALIVQKEVTEPVAGLVESSGSDSFVQHVFVDILQEAAVPKRMLSTDYAQLLDG